MIHDVQRIIDGLRDPPGSGSGCKGDHDERAAWARTWVIEVNRPTGPSASGLPQRCAAPAIASRTLRPDRVAPAASRQSPGDAQADHHSVALTRKRAWSC